MPNKQFAERLNKELDSIGVPLLNRDRVDVVAKLLKVPKFKAESLLNGVITDEKIVMLVAGELEVNADWLLGKSKQRLWKQDTN